MRAGVSRLSFALVLFFAHAAQPIRAADPDFPAQAHRAGSGESSGSSSGQAAKPTGATPESRPSAGQNGAGAKSARQQVKPPQGEGRGIAGLPPKWVEKLRDMSPEEQERFMQNNRRFQTLPPQRQAQIRRNLEKWNNLSPTERNAIRDRERILERLSPEQRAYVQNVLVPKWQAMPQERRNLINGRLHVLQGMTTQQQAEALKAPQFMRGLSGDEQSMLREVYALRNPQMPE